MARLHERLSRAGSKETTLNYQGASYYRAASGSAEKQARDTTLVNAPALVRDLQGFIAKLAEAASRYEDEEGAVRTKLSLDIPALSCKAGT